MILVTGGTGLLGSHLLLALVREHKKVLAVKRPSSDLDELQRIFRRHSSEGEKLFRLIDWVDADLLDPLGIEPLLVDVDRIYHCAGMVSFSKRNRQRMTDFNVQSTAYLVNACLRVGGKRLVHVSSSSAIGKAAPGEKAHEELIWSEAKNHTTYSVSKFRSEMEVWRGMEEGLDALIVNPAIILGDGFWTRGSSSLFHRVARGMRNSTPGMTGYVGVGDVVEAMILLMESSLSGERFLLSEGNYTYSEMMENISEALGTPVKMKYIGQGMLRFLARLDCFRELLTGKRILTAEQAVAAFHTSMFSSSKIRKELNFKFTPMTKVVQQVAEHYRSEFPK